LNLLIYEENLFRTKKDIEEESKQADSKPDKDFQE
jgi:hypothetical protein